MDEFWVHDVVKNNWYHIKRYVSHAMPQVTYWYVEYHYGPWELIKEQKEMLSLDEMEVQIALGTLPAVFTSSVYGKLRLTEKMMVWVQK